MRIDHVAIHLGAMWQATRAVCGIEWVTCERSGSRAVENTGQSEMRAGAGDVSPVW